MIRLIDKEARRTVEFDGATIVLRQLNGGEKLALSRHFAGDGDQYGATADALVPIISKGVISLEGIDGCGDMTVREILQNVDSPQLLVFLTRVLLGMSTLTEEESKNSDSSSDSPSSTGSATGKGVDNASPKKKK